MEPTACALQVACDIVAYALNRHPFVEKVVMHFLTNDTSNSLQCIHYTRAALTPKLNTREDEGPLRAVQKLDCGQMFLSSHEWP